MVRSSFRSTCAFVLCLMISELAASSAAPCYFIAGNSMACYEGTNATALNVTLQAYANSPWKLIYQGSVVLNGECKDSGYNIPTMDPEECSSGASLTVHLDGNINNNVRWAEAEYSVAQDFAEHQGLELQTVLNTLESICKKPVLADARMSTLLDRDIVASPPPQSSHWQLGKTALPNPDPRAIEGSLDREFTGVSTGEADKIAKRLETEADTATRDAAAAQQAAEKAAQAAAKAWRAAQASKHFEEAQPHDSQEAQPQAVASDQSGTESGQSSGEPQVQPQAVASDQSGTESGQSSGEPQASGDAGNVKDVEKKVDRLEKELHELHDLLKSLGRGGGEPSPLTVEAPASSLRGSAGLRRG